MAPSAPPARLSVIVPVLNEAARLPRLLGDLAALRTLGHEVIVVDGGSTDRTREIACSACDRVLASAPGRARQMNAGALEAQGEVLWFLHADTRVPPEAAHAVLQSLRGPKCWGRCRVRLSGRALVYRLIAALMNLRSCLTGIATGDQGVYVTRAAFVAAGGFPAIPLMEDIALSRALKRACGRPVCLPVRLETSSRRWEEHGVLRTVLLMWALRLAYWRGADPADLARRYR
ncbi:TIGR04283 family arsenosugar biosynthesis glycosyltransferase [Thioalkalivibrio paradoxus]|uniref:Glycosyl transferase n=1 Tax=Thioalkalivibrio paradoxus ARh 1 TaxID=713585 RepID=W0DH60_9GAMM|nr:TIGR04283 family arsenosugar biosynthesis glycosyltransferase [Thioalkalivibrio paradoxus]AHE97736.1 glycosyl transferase [Thioalkalivibrio paradoxus ARh 1]